MKKFKKINIDLKWQLILVSVILTLVPMVILGILSYRSARIGIYSQIEQMLRQQASIIKENVNSIYTSANENLAHNISMAEKIIHDQGSVFLDDEDTISIYATNEETQESKNIIIPKMKATKDIKLQDEDGTTSYSTIDTDIIFNYSLIDQAADLLDSVFIVYQIVPDGLLSISTNITDEEEKRVVGTYIPPTSIIYEKIINGEIYETRNIINNEYYLSQLKPIFNSQGTIIGAILAGTTEKSFIDIIKKDLSKIIIGETGYIYMLDSQGNYVLSKDMLRDGENIWESKDANGSFFIQEIVNRSLRLKENETGVTYYPWQNENEKKTRMKLAGYTYLPDLDLIIASSAYQDDFLHTLNNIKFIMTLVCLLALAVCLVITFLFSHIITNPVKQLEYISKMAADGNLNIEIGEKLLSGNGELNNLSKSFSAMINNIKQLIINLKKNIINTVVSSEKLSTSTEEINAAMQQISSTVQQIATGAQNISKVVVNSRNASKLTKESAQKGSEAAMLVNNKMNSISQTIQEGAVKIQSLGEKSKEISNIVEVINNISKQTNLLALNAAIEAARAGEAGRGFAVVADEVRKLAEESENATGQISELTNSIQNEIKSSVKNMELSTTQVNEGVDIVEKALKSFEEIPDLVNNINKSLVEMSAVTEQNAAGSGEVSSAVEEISSFMEQISTTAQLLNRDAENLKNLISNFNINENMEKQVELNSAISDLEGWVNQISGVLDGSVPAENVQVSSHQATKFGEWYYSTGQANYADSSAFQKIESEYQNAFAAGAEAITLVTSDDAKGAQDKYSELESYSKEIIKLLKSIS